MFKPQQVSWPETRTDTDLGDGLTEVTTSSLGREEPERSGEGQSVRASMENHKAGVGGASRSTGTSGPESSTTLQRSRSIPEPMYPPNPTPADLVGVGGSDPKQPRGKLDNLDENSTECSR